MGSTSGFGSPPSIDALFAEWWGGPPADPLFQFDTGAASNLVFGGNPVYQISDFLAIYPKFGMMPQAITAFAIAAVGSGYAINDTIVPQQSDSSGAVIQVTGVNGSGGITSAQLVNGGTGYSTASGLATTTNGSGTGATVNITAIAPGTLAIPQPVLQLYINLASACLQKNRWLDIWQMAMALFVAHFCTLYLQSEGNPVSTAGQIAVSGLSKGLVVSKSAGDVSVSYETLLKDMEGWGAWTQTAYGVQLVQFAKVIGMGVMYIYG